MLMLRVAAREHGTQSRERCAQAPLTLEQSSDFTVFVDVDILG